MYPIPKEKQFPYRMIESATFRQSDNYVCNTKYDIARDAKYIHFIPIVVAYFVLNVLFIEKCYG